MAKNERKATTPLMKTLELQLPGPKRVIKHSDRATSGVPDVTCSWGGHTFWIEDKHWPVDKTLKAILKKSMDQMICAHDLWVTTGGKSWVVVYRDSPREISIWQPRVIVSDIWPTIVIPEIRKIQPATVTADCPNVWNVLKTVGTIRADGWDHMLVVRLIRDYVETLRVQ